MRTMRNVVVGLIFGAAVVVPAGVAAAAANPNAGGMTPGHASSSPGSPFNEPSPGNLGGTGGQHYDETSQYDVACFQVSSP